VPDILCYNDGPKNGKRLSQQECTEIYNALSDRANALREDLKNTELPEHLRAAHSESLKRCEKLIEVFE
jgi:hypothetical protein